MIHLIDPTEEQILAHFEYRESVNRRYRLRRHLELMRKPDLQEESKDYALPISRRTKLQLIDQIVDYLEPVYDTFPG